MASYFSLNFPPLNSPPPPSKNTECPKYIFDVFLEEGHPIFFSSVILGAFSDFFFSSVILQEHCFFAYKIVRWVPGDENTVCFKQKGRKFRDASLPHLAKYSCKKFCRPTWGTHRLVIMLSTFVSNVFPFANFPRQLATWLLMESLDAWTCPKYACA